MRPLVEPLRAGLTADDAWAVFNGEPAVAFLDSRPGYGDLGRWSILALDPWLTLRVWPDRCLVNNLQVDGDPFDVLERLIADHKTEPIPGLPLSGGCIGSIAYDTGFALNGLALPERAAQKALAGYPLLSFDFYDSFLIFDNQQQTGTMMACGKLRPAEDGLADLRRRLERPAARRFTGPAAGTKVSFPDPEDYKATVESVRQEIRDGEVYIANLTGQLSAETDECGEMLYDRLIKINPSPFAAFVRQDGLEIISASPERLLQISSDGQVETRPIKGTRPRGSDPAEDEHNALELLRSGKDQAELLMITDLERNDLSRVCTAESVQVRELFRLETYPAVFHLTASVIGRLKAGVSAVGCLRASFPGGSISGAPKVAAMKIIDRLEDHARSLYTGCLGYFSLDGRADLSILIRTAVKSGRSVFYGAGGGITWESDPEAEYWEMLVKAKAFDQIMRGDELSHAMGQQQSGRK